MNAPPPDAVDLVLHTAQTHQHRIAVQSRHERTTYAEMVDLARRYAAVFTGHRSPRVLIALPRGRHAYASLIGAGLAGGLYTTVNETSPLEKLGRIARLMKPHVVVASAGLASKLADATPGAQCVDPADLGSLAGLSGRGERHETAYVTFTSGSTGEPKGVVVPRGALNHYVDWIVRSGTIGQDDVVSQFNSLAFDVSVLDIYGALCTGATLVPLGGRGDRLMPARAIAREGITVWTSVPSAIDLMRTAQQLTQANLRTVRLFTLAGEPLMRAHLDAIFAVCPHAAVQNAYGPTEATVTVSQMRVTAEHREHACLGNAVSIGPAIPGMQLHLVGGTHPDEGEIVITGPQLAGGYLNDSVRTAAAFRPVEAAGQTVRGYYTGDWAERHRGLIFYRGRIDAQVKVRGHRIELDEVAGAIRALGWPTVCVFKHGDLLAALVECPAGRNLDDEALRLALARTLDAYAIPSRIEGVPALPRNENDKIDVVKAARLLDDMPE